VVLMPLLLIALFAARKAGWPDSAPNEFGFIKSITYINAGLLIFNLLPIYPLDGGQILRSLLWFIVGRARSLMIATIIGFIGVAGLIGVALLNHSFWIGISRCSSCSIAGEAGYCHARSCGWRRRRGATVSLVPFAAKDRQQVHIGAAENVALRSIPSKPGPPVRNAENSSR